MKPIIRTKCVVCDSPDLLCQVRVPDFPIYMGVSDTPGKQLTEDLEYLQCKSCGCMQLRKLIPLDLLYKRNHNAEVVGKVWHEHNKSFIDFMSSTYPCEVLEIGDPQYKMATASDGIIDYKRWTIIEPTVPERCPDRVNYIQGVIDDDFDIYKVEAADTVILSHSLEHMYDPKCILRKIRGMLNYDGFLYISIPNFDVIKDRGFMPPFGMHFEHTFYCSNEYIRQLLALTGYHVLDTHLHEDHSIFYRCKVRDHLPKVTELKNIIHVFKSNHKSFKSKNVFLYSAHFPSQLLLSMGIEQKDLLGVLDNAKSKQSKYLYGTSLKVYPPEKIAEYDDVQVIVKMGPYTKEIKQRLREINSEVIL